jgi:hypothetical protein
VSLQTFNDALLDCGNRVKALEDGQNIVYGEEARLV